jgi:FdrA protein
MTSLSSRVFPRLYRDSVALMAIASSTEARDGVDRVGAVMATPANIEILNESEMLPAGLSAAPDDLVIVVRGETDEIVAEALDAAEAALTSVEAARKNEERPAATIGEGIAAMSAEDAEHPATMVAISIPGTYAAVVAERALRDGLHVFCFSDNVPLEDEVRVKRLARERGLLHMGPDCGTAIIDGVPLGFANVVRRGDVGIVAASGTGAQEVSRLLDLAGAGISQLIGVGGRDLSDEVDGIMTELALDMLEADPETKVIAIVSKPPAGAVADRLLTRLSAIAKDGIPTIACFLGAEDSAEDADGDVIVRGTLEGGAIAAAEASGHHLDVEAGGASPAQAPPGRVLGLYTGGTLASEAKLILKRGGVTEIEVLDLGDDEYTAGKPHPMIDPEARATRIAAAGSDASVGILLLDLVIGYGASPDPATPVVEAVAAARAAAAADGRELLVIGSVCGTPADPQGLDRQRGLLEGAGVVLAPTNAAAARLAAALITGTAAAGARA